MGIVYSLLNNQEDYDNTDVVIDIKNDLETDANNGICGDIQYTNYMDCRHIHLLQDNGINMLA